MYGELDPINLRMIGNRVDRGSFNYLHKLRDILTVVARAYQETIISMWASSGYQALIKAFATFDERINESLTIFDSYHRTGFNRYDVAAFNGEATRNPHLRA